MQREKHIIPSEKKEEQEEIEEEEKEEKKNEQINYPTVTLAIHVSWMEVLLNIGKDT